MGSTSSERTRAELKTLQMGRGLAALAVVLFHTNAVMALPKYFGEDVAPWTRAGYSGVHFFFLLSGVVMILAHGHELGSGSIINFVWRRIRRIFPILWIVLILSLMGSALVGNISNVNATSLVVDFFALPSERNILLAVEWTLRHELLFYSLFAILIWNKRVGFFALATWLALSLFGGLVELQFPWSFLLSPYHGLFGAGILIGHLVGNSYRVPPIATSCLGLAFFSLTWALVCISPPLPINLEIIGFGFGSALMILGFVAIERSREFPISRAFRLMGDASYSIYLIHFMAISLASKLAIKFAMIVVIPTQIWFLFIVSFSVTCGIMLHLLIEKPLLKLIPTTLAFNFSNRRK